MNDFNKLFNEVYSEAIKKMAMELETSLFSRFKTKEELALEAFDTDLEDLLQKEEEDSV